MIKLIIKYLNLITNLKNTSTYRNNIILSNSLVLICHLSLFFFTAIDIKKNRTFLTKKKKRTKSLACFK